jgi:hypothetical protein
MEILLCISAIAVGFMAGVAEEYYKKRKYGNRKKFS